MSGDRYKILPKPLGIDAATQRALIESLPKSLAKVDCALKNIDERECKHEKQISNEIREILSDGKVNRLEAPLFYDILSKCAGDDANLSQDDFNLSRMVELLTEYVSILGIDYESQKHIASTEDMPPNMAEAKPLVVTVDALRAISTSMSIDDISASGMLLAYGRIDAEQMIAQFKSAMEGLEIATRATNRYLERYEESDGTFFGFTSASNLLGLSAYFTDDGSPFSAHDLRAYRNLSAELHEIDLSLAFIIDEIDEGRAPDPQDPRVRTFMDSAFAHLVGSRVPDDTNALGQFRAKTRDKKDYGNYLKEMIEMMIIHDANQLAWECLDQGDDVLRPKEIHRLKRHLPSATMNFFTGSFTMLADDLVSLDSLAMLATGGIVGKLAGATLGGSSLATKFHALRHSSGWMGGLAKATWFSLPGSFLLQSTTKLTLLQKTATVISGIMTEMIKFYGYSATGYLLGGVKGERYIQNAYIFLASAHATFSQSWRNRLTQEISSTKSSTLVDFLAAKGIRDRWVSSLLSELEVAGKSGLTASLRRRSKYLSKVAKRMEKEIALETARAKSCKRMLENLEVLHINNPGKIKPSLLREARKIVKEGGDPGELKELLRRAYRIIGALERNGHKTASRGKSLGRRRGRPGKKKVGKGKKAKGWKPRDKTKNRSSQKTKKHKTAESGRAPRERSPLDRHIDNPPDELSMETISEVTGGKLRVQSGVEKALSEFYELQPKHRSTFWRRVNELMQGNVVGKKVKAADDLWRMRMGKTRAIYRFTDDGVEITFVGSRGNMTPGNKKW